MTMRNAVALLLVLCCLSQQQQGYAFAPSSPLVFRSVSTSGPSTTLLHSDPTSSVPDESSLSFLQNSDDNDDLMSSLPRKPGIRGFFYNRFAGMISGLIGFVTQGIAADDYEYAELPPPYIPAIFGVVLLAGVGILTSSLGDVMDEEASLGLQSGARAKKEIERSRSSYFGKRR